MENKIKKETKLGPKTLVTVKFILTFALLIFYVFPLVSFLNSLGKFSIDETIIEKLMICFMVLGQILIGLFLLIRWAISRKTDYKYVKYERVLVIVYLSLLAGADVLSIFLTFFDFYFNNVTVSEVMFYVFEPLIFGLGIATSVIEQRSRYNEQVWIYNNWYIDEEVDENERIIINEIKNDSNTLKEGEIKNKQNPFKEEWDETASD